MDVYNKERTLLSVFIENENMESINLLLSCPLIDPNVILHVKNEQKTRLSKAFEKREKNYEYFIFK